MKALLSRLQQDVASRGGSVRGQWFPVRYAPDPFTGETMNIGVGFIDAEGKLHTRMLDSFHRLACLYDDRILESDMKYLIAMVEDMLPDEVQHPGDLLSPMSSVTFGRLAYASGSSVENILARLYEDVVTLAAPPANVRRERLRGIDTATARDRVFSKIRDLIPLQAASIIPENSTFMIDDDEGSRHALDIPIRGDNLLGTLVSACQSPSVVRSNMMNAVMDLQVAREYYANDRVGFFVLRDESAPEVRQREIDGTIDALDWKIRAQGIHLDVAMSVATLAEHIIDWSGVTAH